MAKELRSVYFKRPQRNNVIQDHECTKARHVFETRTETGNEHIASSLIEKR